MAAPTILETYPADGDTGIPISEALYVIFDRGVDLDTAKKHIVLYGADSDTSSGPDSAQWINPEDGSNPFYLRSPGYKGVVDCEYELVYLDSSNVELDPQPTIASEAAEVAASYRCMVRVTPKKPLAPEVEYTLYVIGDTSGTGTGVSSRTVFDVVADPGNTGLGSVSVRGGYLATTPDSVVVEITQAGDIGDAKYRWYYSSAGVGSAVTGQVTARRYRRLADGLQVRFTGSGFVVGDQWTFGVEAITYLATSTQVGFTTNDGSFTEAPDSPSTPATSSPPSSAIPGSTESTDYLSVLEMDPADAGSHIDFDGTIEITFSATLDAATITQDTVRVWAYPISGVYEDTNQPVELSKKLTVSGATLTIEVL